MPNVKGYVWLTAALRDKAISWLKANPGKGHRYLGRALSITDYQAEKLVYLIRHDKELLTEAEAVEQLNHQLKWVTAENEQLREERSSVKILADAMTAAVRALPAVKIKPMPRREARDLDAEDVVLFISDVHIGSLLSAEHTGGLGAYSFPIFEERMNRYRDAVRACLRYHPNRLPCCYLVLGGDLVDGSTIFRGHGRQIDLVTVKQVTVAYEYFSHLIADLLELFDEVRVVSVPGNHGRIGMKGENAPHDNLDWLAAWFMAERFRDEPRVKFHNPETWWALLEVRGWRFLVAHGDDVKAWGSIPFYGVKRWKGGMREMFRETFNRRSGEQATFDYVLLAHHHEIADFSGCFMNGNWPGASEFSLKAMQAGGSAYQWMLGVHSTKGVSWSRRLFLTDHATLPDPPVFR